MVTSRQDPKYLKCSVEAGPASGSQSGSTRNIGTQMCVVKRIDRMLNTLPQVSTHVSIKILVQRDRTIFSTHTHTRIHTHAHKNKEREDVVV